MTEQKMTPAFPSGLRATEVQQAGDRYDGTYVAEYKSSHEGMTMRDYFAAKAIPMVSRMADLDNAGTPELAAACYEFADALLEERWSPMVERENARMAADAQHARAERFRVALEKLHRTASLGLHGDEFSLSLLEAGELLEDDEIPF